MDPTFAKEGELFIYRGEARSSTSGREAPRQDLPLYRISGPASAAPTGSIWWDPKSGWLEKVEIPFPDNPDWNSFQLELEGDRGDDAGQWKKYIADSLAKANAKS
jgi:hypothetical protein